MPTDDTRHEAWDGPVPDALTWLQSWYAQQCDGEWEQEFGVCIDTLDNPGWSLTIDLRGTPMLDRALSTQELHRSEHDWYVIRRDRHSFLAACGPLNLGEAIHLFRQWAAGEKPFHGGAG